MFAFNWKNFLHTNPPLTVNEEELKYVFEILDRALDIADEGVVEDPPFDGPCKCNFGLQCDCR